jgi:phosphopantetheine adenylyltransferase
MHLNTLYGIFGRKLETIQTINIFNKDLYNYISTKFIKSIITINDNISTLLINNNLNINLIKDLNLIFESNFSS